MTIKRFISALALTAIIGLSTFAGDMQTDATVTNQSTASVAAQSASVDGESGITLEEILQAVLINTLALF